MLFPRLRSASPPDELEHSNAWLYTGTGRLVASLTNDTIQDLPPIPENPSSRGDDFKIQCSYTAHHASDTISVPGAPRTYTEPTGSNLTFDAAGNSRFHVEPSIATNPRPPQHPYVSFNPALHALSLSNPTCDLSSIKIVTDRDTLIHLLSTCTDQSSHPTANHNGPLEPYRLELIMVSNKTLFLVRRAFTHDGLKSVGHETVAYYKGPSSHEIKRLEARRTQATARKSFVRRFTALPTGLAGVSRMGMGAPVQDHEEDKHYHVVSYTFGRDFKIMVRVQVDAREPSMNESQQPTTQSVDLVKAVTDQAWKAVDGSGGGTTAIPRGVHVSQDRVIDMEVRAVGAFRWLQRKASIPSWLTHPVEKDREPPWEETLPRSWFGRVPQVVKAKHHAGSVTFGPETDLVKADWGQWEYHRRRDLRRLSKLLEWMRGQVGAMEEQGDSKMRRAVFVCENVKGQAVMKLYEVETGFEMDKVEAAYVEKFW